MREIATWVLDLLTVVLIVAAFLALRANVKSAVASEKSANAAHDVFNLERDEYKRREWSERPNLQLFHSYLVKPERPTPATGLFNLPIHIDMMNFGIRPAKIKAARLEVSGKTFDADPRTTTCVRHHEIIRFEVDRNHLDIREAFIEATLGVKPSLQGGGESFLQRLNNPENVSDEYKSVILTINYSETDGSGERTERFTFQVPTYRVDWSEKPLSMRVLHDPNEAERGDLPD